MRSPSQPAMPSGHQPAIARALEPDSRLLDLPSRSDSALEPEARHRCVAPMGQSRWANFMENSMSQIELPLCSFDSLSQMMHIHAYTLGFAWVDAEFHRFTTWMAYKLGHYCLLRLLV